MDPIDTPDEPTAEAPTEKSAAHPLAKAADIGSLGLSAVAALYLLLSISAGLAFQPRQFPGDVLHRIGFVAASAVDLRIGLALVLAAVLAALAKYVGAPSGNASNVRIAGLATIVCAVVAAVLALLAVRAQYHQLDLRNTAPTSAFHFGQATYVVGSVGPAIIAFVLASGPVLGGGRRR